MRSWWPHSLVVLALLAGPAGAATYVATNPSELQTYTDQLVAGDTLLVAAGTYTMATWRIRNIAGTAAAGIDIRPQSGSVVIAGDDGQNVVNIDNVSYVTVTGFEITYVGSSSDIDGVKFNAGTNSDHVTLAELHIHDVTGVGLNSKATELSFFDVVHCHIHDTNGTGEGIYFGCHDGTCLVRDGFIRNCWIHDTNGSQGDGIEIKRSSYRNVLEDNVVHDTNGYPGITMYRTDRGNAADNNVVRRNAVWGSGEGIFAVGETNIENNVVLACGTGISTRDYGGWGMSDLVVANNTVYACSSECVGLRDWGGAGGGMAYRNNAAFQDSAAATAINAPSGIGAATSDHNVHYGTASIAGSSPGLAPAQEFVAPSTVPGVIDLYPLAGSTLFEGGAGGTGIPADDFNLSARPVGAAVDAGAYERDGAGNPGWQIDAGFKPLGPRAGFTGTPLTGPAPLAVQFTDASTGSITTWAWTFGDGATSNQQSPSHTYTSAGSYTVALTVVGSGGTNTLTRPGYVTVTGGAPLANYLTGRGRGQPNANDVAIHTLGGGAASATWIAYGAGQWGTLVGSGDIDGNGLANALTGPGPGAVYGPQVRAFQPSGTAVAKVNFYAYGTLRYGVNVAGAGLDADPPAEILSGAGPGAVFGPHVRGWNYDGGTLAAIAKISFFSYGTLKYGVNVAAGDVEGDGYGELLAAPGPSAVFGPQVRAFDYDGTALGAIAKINFNAWAGGGYGATIASGNPDGDGFDELAAGRGPGAALAAQVKGYDFDGTSISPMTGFDVTPFTSNYGARAALGDLDGDATDELAAAPGEDPAAAAALISYDYDGTTLTPIAAGTFAPWSSAYGAIVATGPFGY